MEILIEKSSIQIKERIESWFLRYFNKNKADFNGSEIFTLFDFLDLELQGKLIKHLSLLTNEIPVLGLKISDTEYIINTTHRFIKLQNTHKEILDYAEFECHLGYKNIVINKDEEITIKRDGYLEEFGLKKKNGEIIYWKIPTGSAGFGFWNITNKCELIGRKFIITG
ncbi:hypothetical protein [Neptunitalea lumnitzerae]|uniref:Uncharacterized protein n=1 Tax=Neptunitalea lumnitzerae TaxID=2965509 RepID=A0ABQ5MJ28_9FLAO|nr:hypothetical protein [Neptunitalea sp. Y10]GLB49383.1 hypothetical protein Y10_17510 [Neptunitalea sp. Y10]